MESLKFNPPDFSEFYLMGTKRSMVCRLKVEALSYWLYTTDPKDEMKIKEVEDDFTLNRISAIGYLAKITYGMNHADALAIAKKYEISIAGRR